MRINETEKNAIVDAVKSVDETASVWLFGSRTDDAKKGGDIDIAVLSGKIHASVMEKIKVQRRIFDKIGEQKIDLVTSSDGSGAFFQLAMGTGIQLT
jgi:predicted nucleotidyltransferase